MKLRVEVGTTPRDSKVFEVLPDGTEKLMQNVTRFRIDVDCRNDEVSTAQFEIFIMEEAKIDKIEAECIAAKKAGGTGAVKQVIFKDGVVDSYE